MGNMNLGQVKDNSSYEEGKHERNPNGFSKLLYILGVLEIASGFFIGLVFDNVIAWTIVGISSAIFIFALAEIMRLLTIIAYKLDRL